MHAISVTPEQAYRRVELDARIEGSGSTALVSICLEAAIRALERACLCDRRGGVSARNSELARANSIILGLERTLDPAQSISGAMREFYGAASVMIGQALSCFDEQAIMGLGQDLREMLDAMSVKAIEP